MGKPRFDPTSEPDVVLAIELPVSQRNEMRRFATKRGQTLEAWAAQSLGIALGAERDIELAEADAKPARRKLVRSGQPIGCGPCFGTKRTDY